MGGCQIGQSGGEGLEIFFGGCVEGRGSGSEVGRCLSFFEAQKGESE